MRLIVATIGLILPGCSLGVLTGKMLFGDPMVTAPFKSMTGTDLVKDEKTVLLVCTAPNYVDNEYSSFRLDLTDGITRRLKRAEVQVVDSNKVSTWIDDRGGSWGGVEELANEFEADYIVHVEINTCTFHEENSPRLYRGRCSGTAYAYEVKDMDGRKAAHQVFVTEFNSVFPPHLPISDERLTEKSFRKQYVDRVADEVSRYFYDYRPGWDF